MILKNLETVSFDFKVYLYLSYAAVLHDVNLDEFIVKNEYRILSGYFLNSHINKTEQEIITHHVYDLMPLICSWAHCPLEVISVIEKHHERPSGNGFPNSLNGTQIDFISAIFIVAHDIAAILLEHKNDKLYQSSIAKLEKDFKGYVHFEEPLKVILNELELTLPS